MGVKLIILISKGLIRDRAQRRSTMFVVAIATILMVFTGFIFFNSPGDSPWRFMIYWFACSWLTLLLILLALYDMIAERARLIAEHRKLKEEMFGINQDNRK